MAARKNLRQIPRAVLDRLKTFAQDDVVAACVKRLRPADITLYGHLGLRLENGNLLVPLPAVLHLRAGKFSRANLEGKDIIRRDLPMIPRTYSWDTPNWGDWGKGSHVHSVTRQIYQREFIPPKELELSVTLLEQCEDGSEFTIKFAVEQVINRHAPDFETDLLYNLNILQENVGAADVFPSAATLAEYVQTVRVEWEILPPGNVGEIVRRMLQGKRTITDNQRAVMESRLTVMAKMKPKAYIAGTNGFLRYFGAQFEDDLVVFENLSYGNAIYVMYENWKSLSERSRVDLLKGPRLGFDRVEHHEGWEERLRNLVRHFRDSN